MRESRRKIIWMRIVRNDAGTEVEQSHVGIETLLEMLVSLNIFQVSDVLADEGLVPVNKAKCVLQMGAACKRVGACLKGQLN